MKTDVVIIGGGIVGCATAYYLAKRGVHVIVVEKNAGVGLEASGCNGGGVRQNGRKAMLPIAIESVRIWEELAKELESDLEYVQTGNINIAIDKETENALENEVTWEKDHGLNDVRMLSAKECHVIVPGLTNLAVAGKICSTDGVANPMLVSPAFAKAGRRLGVKFKLNSKVTSLLIQGLKVCGVQTDSEEIESDIVVNAAGPWAAQFSEQVGCTMPIFPGRSQLMITERLSHNSINLWVSVRGYGYMRPTSSKNLVLGTGGVQNDIFSRHIDWQIVKIQSEYWSSFFPWLNDVAIIRMCAAITEYTPDGYPYIGAVSGINGFYVAAAFHGEGFCTGPMVGKTIANLVLGEKPEVAIDPFHPNRFDQLIKEKKPIPEVVYPFDKMFKIPLDKTV